MIKLGMGDVMRSAFVALWRGGWPVVLCLLLWAGAEVANSTWQRLYNPLGWLVGTIGRGGEALRADSELGHGYRLGLSYLGYAAIGDILRCVFMAALLRILLVGRVGPWGVGGYGLVRASGAVLLVNLAVTVVRTGPPWLFNALLGASVLGDPFGLLEIGSALVFILGLLYLAARLCQVYPSMAVGRGWGLGRHWRLSAGNGIRLTMLIILVMIGYLIINSVVEVVVYQHILSDDPYDWQPVIWVIGGKSAVARVLLTTLLLAMAAVVFARLTEFPAARIPGSGRTPAELAEAFD